MHQCPELLLRYCRSKPCSGRHPFVNAHVHGVRAAITQEAEALSRKHLSPWRPVRSSMASRRSLTNLQHRVCVAGIMRVVAIGALDDGDITREC